MSLQDIVASNVTSHWNLSDDAEFEVGLAELMPQLRRFGRSLSGKREIAEDLAQSTLMKAWQSRRSFLPGTNLKAWLFTILRNEYYSTQRSAWRQVPWDAMLDTMPAPFDEQKWAVELRDTVHAMQGLSDIQRETLILVGVGAFSYNDAAVLSKSAVGSVKSRVGRARRRLKESLDSPERPPGLRAVNGDAVDELLAQLSRLSRTGTPPVLGKITTA